MNRVVLLRRGKVAYCCFSAAPGGESYEEEDRIFIVL